MMNGSHHLSLAGLKNALAGYRPSRVPGAEAMHHAAVAMVLRDDRGEPEILMVRRAEHPDDPWSGHMAFPGGRVEPVDDSYLHAAIRETQEEVGLRLVEFAKFLGGISEIQARSRRGLLALCIHPYVFELTRDVALSPNAEVEGTFWIPLEFFSNPANRSTLTLKDESCDRVLPAYRRGDCIIWGLSLMMLDELIHGVLGAGKSPANSPGRG